MPTPPCSFSGWSLNKANLTEDMHGWSHRGEAAVQEGGSVRQQPTGDTSCLSTQAFYGNYSVQKCYREKSFCFSQEKKVSGRFVECAPCNFPHVWDFLWGCLSKLQHKSDSSKSPGCSVDASSHMVRMSTEACISIKSCLDNKLDSKTNALLWPLNLKPICLISGRHQVGWMWEWMAVLFSAVALKLFSNLSGWILILT